MGQLLVTEVEWIYLRPLSHKASSLMQTEEDDSLGSSILF